MRIPRIFLDLPLSEGGAVSLPPSRSHYLVNVLRLKPGQSIILFNGESGEYEATLNSVTKKTASITITNFIALDKESPIYSELAIGVSRGDRMDWIIQKTTELGVNSITPLLTERSELKLNAERWQKKLTHWREIIINACEQCGRNRLPILQEPVTFDRFVSASTSSTKLILHPHTESPLDRFEKPSAITLAIGPEGGFSEEEVGIALQNGFKPWCLGPRVLRTETAPVAALSVLQSKFGDF